MSAEDRARSEHEDEYEYERRVGRRDGHDGRSQGERDMAVSHEEYRESLRVVRRLAGRAATPEGITDEELIEHRTHVFAVVTRFEAVRRGIVGTRALAGVIAMSEDIVKLVQRIDAARAEALAHAVLSEPTAVVEMKDGTVLPSGGLDSEKPQAPAAAA